MTIWIDLENSPHALFFPPLIARLEARGDRVLVTARDCSQTLALLDLSGIPYRRVGSQWRGPAPVKALGVTARALRLAAVMRGRGVEVSVSHSSRSHVLASRLLGIPVVTLLDYEHAAMGVFTRYSAKILAPQAIPRASVLPGEGGPRFVGYPGFKEQVYATAAPPDPRLARELGCGEGDVVAVARPPATRAHYHTAASDAVFTAALERLVRAPAPGRVILLPRYPEQARALRDAYPGDRVLVLEHAVPGHALLSLADLVVSGGGTMVREAVSMGIPAYSVFQSRMGAVDAALVRDGHLIHLATEHDADRIAIRKRDPGPGLPPEGLIEFLVEEIRSPGAAAR